ncbi:DUF305 domain-containing protein [Rhodococcus phenolicus]|uniref:DUF305 domain-containing protein n=1 Tax=Rhodococcus phenolicus TaxID=263849 RepID=UPI000835C061
MYRLLATGTASVAVLLSLTACGGAAPDRAEQVPGPAATATSNPGAEEDHNDADVMFAAMMIPHHRQAVEMSEIVLAKSDIPAEVRTLAEEIRAAQAPEIEQLTAWLDEWNAATSMPMTSMPMDSPGHDMPMNSPDHEMPMGEPETTAEQMPGDMSGMEGMLSPQDLQALRDAEGTDAARLYMTQMIAHHQGAVAMAQGEIEHGRNPAAVDMARQIVDTQQQEITTMEQLLAQ